MHDSPASHRLPDELIIAIFSYTETLDASDLYQLCLVSRRFLSTAQQSLYRDLVFDVTSLGRDHLPFYVEYCVEDWQLVRTLEKEPNLGRLVRSVVFSQVELEEVQDANRREGSGVKCRDFELVLKVLEIAPGIKEIEFSGTWYGLFDSISDMQDLEKLDVENANQHELVRMSETFPRLKHYKFHHLNNNRPRPLATFPCLEILEVKDSFVLPDEIRPLLVATSTTLRTLSLSLEILLDLDFSEFPFLQTLHIGHFYSEPQGHNLPDRFDRFFDSISKIPRLDTLSFDPEPFSSRYESLLFPNKRHWKDPWTAPIPSRPLLRGLKFLRFVNDVSLTRIVRILNDSWSANVEKIFVLPDFDESDDGYDMTLDGLRGILKPRKIELVFDESLIFCM
ncbi:uncharacterized protein JCM6883_005314 [Sporobolomyces salmoneus]|uniref:uncharacterized protein n=1 Tax=Sporobolomyces salmoneus TaxID=183962 RepID=UPI0031712DFA